MTERVVPSGSADPMLAFIEAMPDGMVVSDTEGQIVLVNGQLEKLSGYPADELVGREVEVLVPDHFRPRHLTHRKGYYESGLPPRTMGTGLDIFLQRKDGGQVPVDIALGTIRLGGRTLVVSAVRDATERRRTEAAIRETERRWRTLLENVHLVVVGLDLDRRITYANRFLRELSGYTRAELDGRDWFSVCLPDEISGEVVGVFDRILGSESPSHHVNAIKTKRGEQRLIAWNNALLRDPEGNPVGTLSIGEDITERQQAEARIAAVNEVAQAILENRPIDDVVRIIARCSRELVRASLATIVTLDEDRETLTVQVADGEHADDLEHTRFPALNSISLDVMRSRHPVSLPDASTDPRDSQPIVRNASIGPALLAPLAVRDRAFGTLVVGRPLGARPFTDDEQAVIEVFASQAAIALEHARYQQELHRLAVLEDRERIGRDLHDGAIQALFATGMRLQSTLTYLDGEPAKRIDQAVDDIDEVIGELRGYIFDLRPGAARRREISETLRRLGRELEDSAGVATVIDIDARADIAVARTSDLVQLVREALSNVGRHAQAATCRVFIGSVGDGIVVEVTDDGQGFHLHERASAGYGLSNLRERASALGATSFEIDTSPGNGTRVRVLIPATGGPAPG